MRVNPEGITRTADIGVVAFTPFVLVVADVATVATQLIPAWTRAINDLWLVVKRLRVVIEKLTFFPYHSPI